MEDAQSLEARIKQLEAEIQQMPNPAPERYLEVARLYTQLSNTPPIGPQRRLEYADNAITYFKKAGLSYKHFMDFEVANLISCHMLSTLIENNIKSHSLDMANTCLQSLQKRLSEIKHPFGLSDYYRFLGLVEVYKGMLLKQKQDFKEAINEYKKAIDYLKDAKRFCNKKDDKTKDLCIDLGRVLMNLEESYFCLWDQNTQCLEVLPFLYRAAEAAIAYYKEAGLTPSDRIYSSSLMQLIQHQINLVEEFWWDNQFVGAHLESIQSLLSLLKEFNLNCKRSPLFFYLVGWASFTGSNLALARNRIDMAIDGYELAIKYFRESERHQVQPDPVFGQLINFPFSLFYQHSHACACLAQLLDEYKPAERERIINFLDEAESCANKLEQLVQSSKQKNQYLLIKGGIAVLKAKHQDLHHANDAIDFFKQALEIQESRIAHINQGAACALLGLYEDALIEFWIGESLSAESRDCRTFVDNKVLLRNIYSCVKEIITKSGSISRFLDELRDEFRNEKNLDVGAYALIILEAFKNLDPKNLIKQDILNGIIDFLKEDPKIKEKLERYIGPVYLHSKGLLARICYVIKTNKRDAEALCDEYKKTFFVWDTLKKDERSKKFDLVAEPLAPPFKCAYDDTHYLLIKHARRRPIAETIKRYLQFGRGGLADLEIKNALRTLAMVHGVMQEYDVYCKLPSYCYCEHLLKRAIIGASKDKYSRLSGLSFENKDLLEKDSLLKDFVDEYRSVFERNCKDEPRTFIHGDAHHLNIMETGYLVDFEFAHYGNPLLDVVYVIEGLPHVELPPPSLDKKKEWFNYYLQCLRDVSNNFDVQVLRAQYPFCAMHFGMCFTGRSFAINGKAHPYYLRIVEENMNKLNLSKLFTKFNAIVQQRIRNS
ncbi:MAG: phosphotransferase [Candidatus Woesearchaeota archaeon]